MSNEYRSIEERVDGICKWTNQGLRDAVLQAMKEIARDQRHLCSEAVNKVKLVHAYSDIDKIDKHETYQAVFNARLK